VGVNLAKLDAAVPADADILLDTTTLIAYLEGGQIVSDAATRIVDGYVKSARNRGLVSAVAIMELLVKPIQNGAQAETLLFLTAMPNLVQIDVDFAVAVEAAHLRARHGFRPPDALIVASGIVHQAKYLVTNDAAWKNRLAHLHTPEVIVLSDFVA